MRKSLVVVLLAASFAAAGCQAPAHVSQVSKKEQEFGKHFTAKNCRLETVRGNYLLYESKIGQDIVVNSIVYGRDGWVQLDVTSRNIRDNVYFNRYYRKVVCGARNWAKQGTTFVPTDGLGDAPLLIPSWYYTPSREVELVRCRFADGTVIGEDPERCRKVGGEIIADDKASK